MNIPSRILKPLPLPLMVPIALNYRALSYGAAAICCLIPLVLSQLNILNSAGNVPVGITLMTAAVVTDAYLEKIKEIAQGQLTMVLARK